MLKRQAWVPALFSSFLAWPLAAAATTPQPGPKWSEQRNHNFDSLDQGWISHSVIPQPSMGVNYSTLTRIRPKHSPWHLGASRSWQKREMCADSVWAEDLSASINTEYQGWNIFFFFALIFKSIKQGEIFLKTERALSNNWWPKKCYFPCSDHKTWQSSVAAASWDSVKPPCLVHPGTEAAPKPWARQAMSEPEVWGSAEFDYNEIWHAKVWDKFGEGKPPLRLLPGHDTEHQKHMFSSEPPRSRKWDGQKSQNQQQGWGKVPGVTG